jgi:hypothetical protein
MSLSKKDVNLLQTYLVRFINSQKERIGNKEIGEGTLRNYMKAIKLFFSMNDIIVNWNKLSKGIPQVYGKQDRIPTLGRNPRFSDYVMMMIRKK